jgi:hypothetical protein
LLAGRWPAWRWPEDGPPGLDGLEAAARDCAAFWDGFVGRPYDPDRRVEVRDPRDRQIHDVALGVILAQVLDHAVIRSGTTEVQQSVVLTLGAAAGLGEAPLRPPVVVVIGDVVRLSPVLQRVDTALDVDALRAEAPA